jgi:hypothetical protein
MEILAVTALIALVVFGVMVLRLKNDPMENEVIRKSLADFKRARTANPLIAPEDAKPASKQ